MECAWPRGRRPASGWPTPRPISARSAPSARSVRFYVANGLLDRPEGAGTAATYNYRHLLQLLSIKIRQREGATLDGIKNEMREVTGDALERRVAASLAPALGARSDVAVRNTDDDPLVAMREAVRAALGRADIR